MNTQLSISHPKVIIHAGKVVTTSHDVAEYFHKLHKNVIQKIETLDCSPEFASANFSAHVENIKAGAVYRDSKTYQMTKDGFVFLVMGFTGKKAAAFKEAYIAEFNRMEAELMNPRQKQTTVDERTPLRDAVNLLVSKKSIMYPEAYSFIHQRFNVPHIDNLTSEQLPQAIEYIHKLALEGEYLPKQEALPEPMGITFTEDETLALVTMCNAANFAQQNAKKIYPSLAEFGSHFTGEIYDIAHTNGIQVRNGTKVLLAKVMGLNLTGLPWKRALDRLMLNA